MKHFFGIISGFLCIAISGTVCTNLFAQQPESAAPVESTAPAETAPVEEAADNTSLSLEDQLKALSAPETDAKENEGDKLLDEAVLTKIAAVNLKDSDKVLELCNKALEKGLNPKNVQIAQELIRATLLQRITLLSEALRSGRFSNPQEVKMVISLATNDMEKIRSTLPKNKKGEADDQNFDGADIFWFAQATLSAFSGEDDSVTSKAIVIAKKLNADNPARLAQLLFLEAMVKDDSQARLSLLQQAQKEDPESTIIQRALAKTYGELKMYDKAVKIAEPLLEGDPEDPMLLAIMADYYTSIKDSRKTLEILNKLDKMAPGNEAILWQKIKTALDLQDYPLMMELSTKVLKSDPQNEPLLLFRANYLFKEKKYDEAIRELDQLLFFNEKSIEAQTFKAAILCKKDKANFADARKLIDPIIGNPNSDAESLKACLPVLHEMDEKVLTIETLERIVKADPGDYSSLQTLVYAFLDAGNKDKVKPTFEQLVQKFPENETVLNNYSWYLSTNPDDSVRDGKKALECALKAALLSNYKEAYILSTLAAAYAENGDFDKAMEWIQKSSDLCSDKQMKESIEKEKQSYQQKKAWREDPLSSLND